MSHSIDQAKRVAAIQAVKENFPINPQYVGIGSGTTMVYVVEAITALDQDVSRVCFIPTGYQSRQLIISAGLLTIQYDSLPESAALDICFDGADEVDDDLNCIKGGGACLFQEKLVAMRSKKFICVADHRKLQPRLLTSWPTIPIEVAPIAARQVHKRLIELGSPDPKIREGVIAKAGPQKTDQDFFIIDAPFPPLLTITDVKDHKARSSDRHASVLSASSSTNASLSPQSSSAAEHAASTDTTTTTNLSSTSSQPQTSTKWEVQSLATAIKSIEGVLEVGLFCGRTGPEALKKGTIGGQRPIACYFGMADGSVTVRTAAPYIES